MRLPLPSNKSASKGGRIWRAVNMVFAGAPAGVSEPFSADQQDQPGYQPGSDHDKVLLGWYINLVEPLWSALGPFFDGHI